MLSVCVHGVLSVCVLRPTAVGGGRINAISQSFSVRSGCPLDVRQLLQRVSQSHHHDGVNLNILKFFLFIFSFLLFFWFFQVSELHTRCLTF